MGSVDRVFRDVIVHVNVRCAIKWQPWSVVRKPKTSCGTEKSP